MSNAQTQTRGLSAGDWVRLKRLIGARTYDSVNLDTDKDIDSTPYAQLPYHLPIHSFKVVGTSKIRRTASAWTDYRASQTADYVLPNVIQATSPPTLANELTKICNCLSEPLSTKYAGCSKCVVPTHVRIM